jgi:hypothetical protein
VNISQLCLISTSADAFVAYEKRHKAEPQRRGEVAKVRVCGIARRTPMRKPTTLHNPNTPFLFIKLLRKHLNSNLLSLLLLSYIFLRI